MNLAKILRFYEPTTSTFIRRMNEKSEKLKNESPARPLPPRICRLCCCYRCSVHKHIHKHTSAKALGGCWLCAAFVLTLLSLLLGSWVHPFALRTFQISRKQHTNMLLRAVCCSAGFVWPAQLWLSMFVALSLNAVRPAFSLRSATVCYWHLCKYMFVRIPAIISEMLKCSSTVAPLHHFQAPTGGARLLTCSHALSLQLLVAPLNGCSACGGVASEEAVVVIISVT